MVTPLYLRTGKAVVANNYLYFFDELKSISSHNQYNESTIWKKNIEFIKFKKSAHSLLSKRWDLSDIWAVHYRSFLSK